VRKIKHLTVQRIIRIRGRGLREHHRTFEGLLSEQSGSLSSVPCPALEVMPRCKRKRTEMWARLFNKNVEETDSSVVQGMRAYPESR